MPIRFPCPACEKTLKASDAMAGRAVCCPRCLHPTWVPGEAPPPPATEEVLDLSLAEFQPAESQPPVAQVVAPPRESLPIALPVAVPVGHPLPSNYRPAGPAPRNP